MNLKISFKKITTILAFFQVTGTIVFAQSIRKDFREMTNYERDELVNGFYALRQGPDLFNDMAVFHADFFNFDGTNSSNQPDLHYNLPDEPTREIFLVWHRQMLFEIEQALQDVNPDVSIPFWNSVEEQSTNGLLWSNAWLGPFDNTWGLNRRLGDDGPLPSNNTINNLMNITDFFTFSNTLERQAAHRGGHVWIGGAMNSPLSPRDPGFYFHHSFQDKLWQDWETIHQSSSYQRNNMLRYDGTYRFNGETYPLVNPNDLLDSRVLGVFYAENGLAQMDNYIVSNTYRPEEVFYYQFDIEAGDNFIVPEGTSSRMVSVNQIRLLPGFTAEPGASFRAYIDRVNVAGKSVQKVREFNPYPYNEAINKPIVWEEGETETERPLLIVTASPNPFQDKITINLNKKINCSIEVFNMMGMLIRQESFENTSTLEIHDLYGLSSGYYVIRVIDAFGNPLVIKRVVKL